MPVIKFRIFPVVEEGSKEVGKGRSEQEQEEAFPSLGGNGAAGSVALPTHVFVQAGVGGLAAAVCAQMWQRLGAARPRFVIVEPARAACLMATARAGRPRAPAARPHRAAPLQAARHFRGAASVQRELRVNGVAALDRHGDRRERHIETKTQKKTHARTWPGSVSSCSRNTPSLVILPSAYTAARRSRAQNPR